MTHVRVLFFASLKDRLGRKTLELELPPPATVASLKQVLASRHPEIAPALPAAIAARNHEFAFPSEPLSEGDEVALFPPVSGGREGNPTLVAVVTGPLDLDELVHSVTLPTTGAVGVFAGIVRQVDLRRGSRQTEHLEYEAYLPMAEAKLRQVAAEIRARWPTVEGIAIVQRVGSLDPGTATVFIACSAPHRDMGIFEAARYGIDRLKEIVPIWKKEVGPQGEAWVEGDYHPTPGDISPP